MTKTAKNAAQKPVQDAPKQERNQKPQDAKNADKKPVLRKFLKFKGVKQK